MRSSAVVDLRGTLAQLSPWSQDWSRFLRRRGHSPRTVYSYLRCAIQFEASLRAAGVMRAPTDGAGHLGALRLDGWSVDASRWNYDRLLNYLEIFQEHNPRTVNAQFSAVSHLVKHVARHHGFPTLDMERFWEEELRIYTTQIKKLRAHRVNTPPRFESMQRAVGMEPNLRNRALLLLAAKTGARKSEILSLDWEDIDLDEGIVRFKPDQHHKRTSFVGLIDSETIVALRLWRGQCKHTASPAEKAVFVGTTAKSAGERLGRQGAFIVVGDAFERVGSKSYNVHSMRHWFSDTLRARGMPDHMIAYLRGDAPSSTLDLYTHLESEDGMKKLRIAYDAAMPSLCC